MQEIRLTFNRTFKELKFTGGSMAFSGAPAFNRTFKELKCKTCGKH